MKKVYILELHWDSVTSSTKGIFSSARKAEDYRNLMISVCGKNFNEKKDIYDYRMTEENYLINEEILNPVKYIDNKAMTGDKGGIL